MTTLGMRIGTASSGEGILPVLAGCEFEGRSSF